MWIAGLLLWGALGWAEEPSEQRVRLTEAVQHYLDGDPSTARADLQKLLGLGPELADDVRRDAMAWLGDILYSEEGERAARNAFETLLAEDPTYTLDSFQHPPEVVSYFEQVKTEWIRSHTSAPPPTLPPPTLPPPTLRPYPATILVPGGLYYYLQDRPGVGATLTTLQVGCLAGSIWLNLAQKAIPMELEPGQESELQRARTLQALNWTVATAGWLSLAVPILVESSRWGTERAEIRLQLDTKSVQVQGSF